MASQHRWETGRDEVEFGFPAHTSSGRTASVSGILPNFGIPIPHGQTSRIGERGARRQTEQIGLSETICTLRWLLLSSPQEGIMADNRESTSQKMSNDLTGAQIFLLCKIGEHNFSKLASDKEHNLEWLMSEGYVVATEDPGFKLTAKGINYLGMIGAGLNES
jgi:hypothetical protein